MVMRFGMSEKLGPRVFGHDHGQPFLGREFSSQPDYSKETALRIDREIRLAVDEAYIAARQLLETHRAELHLTSESLLQCETIEREQFLLLLAGVGEGETFASGASSGPEPVSGADDRRTRHGPQAAEPASGCAVRRSARA
jgi:cell division protease FtsH